jgi:hypothetical protein
MTLSGYNSENNHPIYPVSCKKMLLYRKTGLKYVLKCRVIAKFLTIWTTKAPFRGIIPPLLDINTFVKIRGLIRENSWLIRDPNGIDPGHFYPLPLKGRKCPGEPGNKFICKN